MSLSLLWKKLQSHSSQQDQQPGPVCTWSAHAPQSGPSKSPLPRYYHAISATATAAGELFLFGGYAYTTSRDNGYTRSDDLYVISTRDFSTTLLQTSGEVPSPRSGHDTALTSTNLLIWGGNVKGGPPDDSLRLLNLSTSYLLMSRPTPADQSVLCSSISRVDAHRAQWPRTRRSLPPYRDNGRFQVLCLWWSDRRRG